MPDWLSVSRETFSKLDAFLDLVGKWNPRINLVSTASLADGWRRHVLDSAQLWGLAAPSQGIWLDIGSGGGFPGLIIAILSAEFAPALRVVLVESDRRKAVFLSEAIRQLNLPAIVHATRIEMLSAAQAHVISARALAPLVDLLPMVQRHAAANSLALLPKGQNHGIELQACLQTWHMQSEVIPSKTDPDAAIVKIWDLQHV